MLFESAAHHLSSLQVDQMRNFASSIAGFLRPTTCICGAEINDCIFFRCELAIYIAAVAYGLRCVICLICGSTAIRLS